jgi:hypothetical protein
LHEEVKDWETSFDEYLEHLREAVRHSDRHSGLIGYCRGLMLLFRRKGGLHAILIACVVFEVTTPGAIAGTSPIQEKAMSEIHGLKRVLFVGQEPETVDFSDPALPPGFDAAKIDAGISVGMQQMEVHGWRADLCLVKPDETAPSALERQLTTSTYDCVVIGGGIRIPPKSLLLFEALVNTAHKCAPNASIAFNTRPEDTAEAAARWLSGK